MLAMPSFFPAMAQKRPFDEGPTIEPVPEQSVTTTIPQSSAPVTPFDAITDTASMQNGIHRQSSPAPSTISTLSSLSATPTLSTPSKHTHSPGAPVTASPANGPPTKKRKLTPQEKEQHRLEKEAKQREREAQKAQREAEKAEKAEERRQKNEEKEEKRRQRELEQQKKEQERDEKKRAKEAEKQREEEEKLKKERAQSRIMNFFARPVTSAATAPNQSSAPNQHDEKLKQIDGPEQPSKETGNDTAAGTRLKSDYERTFLPFQTPLHGKWAKANHFTFDEGAIKFHQETFDTIQASSSDLQPQRQIKNVFDLAPLQSIPKGYIGPTTKDIMEQLENSSENPTQPSDAASSLRKPLETLRNISVKYLLFHEDVRPPYVGTYTKLRSREEARRLARQPFRRARNELDYDYDSEAEWEEPEEGEDLDSEGESDSGSEAADEMDDFLDDEEDAADGSRLKKRMVASDMEPITSGVCFENAQGKCLTASEVAGFDLEDLRLELLDGDASFPIDPFQSASTAEMSIRSNIFDKSKTATAHPSPSSMARLPLQTKTNTSFLMPNTSSGPTSSRPGPKSTKPAKTNPRFLAGTELEQFKEAVSGSDLPKVPLLGVLKRQFKKVPNEVLKDTLEAFAQRVGPKRDDKKWVIVESQV